MIVENRTGASSNLAGEAVARSAPDGYTLLFVTTVNAINATFFDNLKFDLKRDFAPVSGVTRVPNVLKVNPSVPANNVAEFIAYAKANPGKLNMASTGNGTSIHLAGELFKAMTGTNLVHVPYRSPPQAMTDLLAGQVQVMFDVMTQGLAAHQGRPPSRARGDDRDALGRAAGRADGRRDRARLRSKLMERRLRAERERHPRSSRCSTGRSMPP